MSRCRGAGLAVLAILVVGASALEETDPFRTSQEIRPASFFTNYLWSDEHEECVFPAFDQQQCGSW